MCVDLFVSTLAKAVNCAFRKVMRVRLSKLSLLFGSFFNRATRPGLRGMENFCFAVSCSRHPPRVRLPNLVRYSKARREDHPTLAVVSPAYSAILLFPYFVSYYQFLQNFVSQVTGCQRAAILDSKVYCTRPEHLADELLKYHIHPLTMFCCHVMLLAVLHVLEYRP